MNCKNKYLIKAVKNLLYGEMFQNDKAALVANWMNLLTLWYFYFLLHQFMEMM